MFRMGLRLILKVTNETLISTQKKKKKKKKKRERNLIFFGFYLNHRGYNFTINLPFTTYQLNSCEIICKKLL